MGDRALIQMTDGVDYSPTLYMHWDGPNVAGILERTQRRMRDRPNDLAYAFARLVQEAIGNAEGNLSFGVSNCVNPVSPEASCGDAGVFLVNVRGPQWIVAQGGGYGLVNPDNLVVRSFEEYWERT